MQRTQWLPLLIIKGMIVDLIDLLLLQRYQFKRRNTNDIIVIGNNIWSRTTF